MSDEQKLLAACVEYRTKLDKLEAENAALRKTIDDLREQLHNRNAENAALREEVKTAKADRDLAGWDDYAVIAKLKSENAALRVALEDIMTESDEQVIWRMARAALEQKEAQP